MEITDKNHDEKENYKKELSVILLFFFLTKSVWSGKKQIKRGYFDPFICRYNENLLSFLIALKNYGHCPLETRQNCRAFNNQLSGILLQL